MRQVTDRMAQVQPMRGQITDEPVYDPGNIAITSTAFNRFCGRFPRVILPLANISFYATSRWLGGGGQCYEGTVDILQGDFVG